MPHHVVRLHLAALLAVCGISAAHAMPFGVFDPRSLGMGGTGVASGTSGNASYFNPALLSAPAPGDSFSIELPMGALRVADPDKLRDDVDNLKNSGDNVSSAIDQLNQAVSGGTLADQQAAAGQLATALNNFRPVLNAVNDKELEGTGFAAPLTIGVPGPNLGWGLFVSGRADLGARFLYASSDDTLLQNCAALAQTASTGTAADMANLLNSSQCGGGGTNLSQPQYQSRVNVRGVAVVEAGVSLAHRFESLGGLALGVTPKSVRVNTFDYSLSPQQAEISTSEGRLEYSSFNFDVGAVKEITPALKAGLVVKNVIPHGYDTVLGNRVELKPQARLGLSHRTSWTTLAVDVDLTRNEPVGFELPTRFLGIGAELDVRLLKLRLGYQRDLTGNYKGMPSLGLGFSIFGVHLDAAVAARGKDEAVASAQLGFRY